MLIIDLVRHVKVDGEPALYGHTDVDPLTENDSDLLDILFSRQKRYATYQQVICSPLIRCQRVAKKIALKSQLPLTIIEGFKEMNFGVYDGVAFEDIPFEEKANEVNMLNSMPTTRSNSDLDWSVLNAFFQEPAKNTLPDAETLTDFNYRVVDAWQTLIQKALLTPLLANKVVSSSALTTKNEPKRILVVAHGGVIRMILAHILKLDWQQGSWYQHLQIANASLSQVSVSLLPENTQKECDDTLQSNKTQKNQQLHQQVVTIAMPLVLER